MKAGTPGAISAGLSTGSGCTGAVIGELEGWGDLWTLKAEGMLYYTGPSQLTYGLQKRTQWTLEHINGRLLIALYLFIYLIQVFTNEF